MPDNTQALTIIQIIDRCRQERRPNYPGLPSSPGCVELFRRAFQGEQAAWTALQEVFSPLLRSWVGVQQRIEAEDVLQEVFLNFYRRAPEVPSLVATDQLGPVLAYLKQCTKNALLQLLRKDQRNKLATTLDTVENLASSEDVGGETALRIALQQRLDELIRSDKERLVFYLRFICNIKPQFIFQEHGDIFDDYKEVAQIIQNLTRRLSHDQVLQNLNDARQKPIQPALLTIRVMEESAMLETQKDRNKMTGDCTYTEELLLDYITGLASSELRAAIEQSSVCLQAARALAEEIGPWLIYLHRFTCPDVERIVAYQQKQLDGTERLVMRKHIEGCPRCREEIALLEAVDAVPLTAQPTLVRRVIEAVLRSPLLTPQPVRGELRIYQSPQIHVILSTRKTNAQARTWTLRGQLRTADGQLITAAEGAFLLNLADPDQVEEQTMLDRNGFFVWKGLAAGSYRLRILTSQEEIVIREIVIGADG